MKVALTGATGVLGGAIATAALAAGHEVRALVRDRDGREVDDSRVGIDWISGGLEDADALDRLVDTADAIVHCAFADTEATEAFVAANVVGTLRLLIRAGATSLRRFIYVSSLAVYGKEPWLLPHADALPLDEDFPLWPRDFYGAHKIAMEKMVIAGSGDPGLRTSAFRVGCVLGEYPSLERNHIARFLAAARDDGAIRERMGAYVIAADDAANILVDALGDTATTGLVINTFDRWLDFAELAGPIGAVLGREVSVECESAPPPHPALLRDRLAARQPAWTTDSTIRRLLSLQNPL